MSNIVGNPATAGCTQESEFFAVLDLKQAAIEIDERANAQPRVLEFGRMQTGLALTRFRQSLCLADCVERIEIIEAQMSGWSCYKQ